MPNDIWDLFRVREIWFNFKLPIMFGLGLLTGYWIF